jgi:cell division septation protein DedD
MAENRRGKENRFYFSRVQMLLMGVAFGLASLAIFLLGMFVGKGIEERKIAKKEEPLVKIPVAPEGGVSGTQAQKKDEITFNNSVAKAPTAPLVEEIAKEEKPAVKTAKTEIPAPKVERKTEKAAVETTSKQTETGGNAESTDQSKTWRVQVNAFPDDRSAKLLVDRLKNKGYNAYVSEVENAGKTWYRVSVGQYSTRKEADKVLEVLKTKEKFPKAFAASK